MALITEMNCAQAKAFFLKNSSYCDFNLPSYFNFEPLLQSVVSFLNTQPTGLNNVGGKAAFKFEKVNYKLNTNKDGGYSWRTFELIHPAIYVELVNTITEARHWQELVSRFASFQSNPKIVCTSLPRSSTTNHSDTNELVKGWWENVHQESFRKALDFKYVFTTDIANFYPSIYTHSIPWAIYTMDVAKTSQNDENLGNNVDRLLRSMSWGQTNGIPQGSVLMDFIAELIVGYADELLSNRLEEEGVDDYHIIRYRDDYKIFTNSKEQAEIIAKFLTEILSVLGLQLNALKTNFSDDIVLSTIKPDKQEAILLFGNNIVDLSIQNTLLKISIFSRNHKNSRQINTLLKKVYACLISDENFREDVEPLISIVTDIMVRNPCSLADGILLLSKLLDYVDHREKLNFLHKIKSKFEPILGTGLIDIWLQRLSYPIVGFINYREKICSMVENVVPRIQNDVIWNCDWITSVNLKKAINANSFIDYQVLSECSSVISEEEASSFGYDAIDGE